MIERQDQRFFRGLDLNSLAIDEAFVNVTSNLINDLFIYVLNEECYKCPYQLYGNVRLHAAGYLLLLLTVVTQSPF